MAKDILNTRTARTSTPKKIDEWRLSIPGGKSAVVDVKMQHTDDGVMFTATSDHPDFASLNLRSRDINLLQDAVREHAAGVISSKISTDWHPCRLIALKHDARHESANKWSFELSLSLTDLEVRTDIPVGNRGETVVRDEHSQSVVVQRSHDDDYSDVRSLQRKISDPENVAYMRAGLSGEDTRNDSRTVLPGRPQEAVALIETLHRFSRLLATRVAPQAIATGGVPTNEELVTLMREAADAEPESLPEGPRGWRF